MNNPDEIALVPMPCAALVASSEVPSLLDQIRPQWRAKDLIQRVRRLLAVDPSSACQRVFNAAMHDMREKVEIAGLDIAEQAAKLNKLPPVSKPEDIENYPIAKLIDLAYRMGLISRPEWRRLSRSYEIRRDLEHEDDEYEAGIEDCIYIFKTCVDVVLSRDPIQAIRVTDVKDLVNSPDLAEPSQELVEDYEHAPQPRQQELCKFLVSTALDSNQAEVVRQNSYRFLVIFAEYTHNQVKLDLAHFMMERIGRQQMTNVLARVAIAAGVFPYLREKQREDFYPGFLEQMRFVGASWRSFAEHGELLRTFQDCGGLLHCPAAVRQEIIVWLVLTYIGIPGGVTSYGNVRHVFYSNNAAPLIEEMVKAAGSVVEADIEMAGKQNDVQRLCRDPHIARRFEELLDLTQTGGKGTD